MWPRRRFAALPITLTVRAQAASAWQLTDRLDTALSAFTLSPGGTLAAAGDTRLYTSRDGFTWTASPIPAPAASLAFSGDNLWLVSAKGLHASSDEGKTWRLAHKADALNRVTFADTHHGYATGARKTILETTDAGRTWTPLAAAAEPSTNPHTTTFHWADFVTPRVGVITGASLPARKGLTGPLPAWRDPKRAQRRPEVPSASLTLETRDGGRTWKHSATSLFGRITRVRYSRDAHGLALVEFHDRFDYPSEVFSIDLRTGASQRAFRRKDRAVTDLLLFPGPSAVLAAIEPPADPAVASQGLLRLLVSSNLQDWDEQSTSREINAGRAWLAGWTPDDVWAATDTGAVLHWKP